MLINTADITQFAYFYCLIENMATTKITVNNNGSLRIEGDFEVIDKTGAQYNLGEGKLFLSAVVVFPKINHSAMVRTTVILNTMQWHLICLLKNNKKGVPEQAGECQPVHQPVFISMALYSSWNSSINIPDTRASSPPSIQVLSVTSVRLMISSGCCSSFNT